MVLVVVALTRSSWTFSAFPLSLRLLITVFLKPPFGPFLGPRTNSCRMQSIMKISIVSPYTCTTLPLPPSSPSLGFFYSLSLSLPSYCDLYRLACRRFSVFVMNAPTRRAIMPPARYLST
ncbi:hypothetical protein BJV74DRAFT_55292 [Russula compacta]|nr:hypothetical protein BJV74DRAFT_55292 [Russula compacta]